MKKFLLLILSIILISFLVFILWMNLTPGYFQYSGCLCKIGYLTDEQAQEGRNAPICAVVGVCGPVIGDKPLLLLAKLDFNRSAKFVDTNESPPIPIPQGKTGAEGKFCGGIAANLPQNQCPAGYKCQLDGKYPDASGHCVKSGLFGF